MMMKQRKIASGEYEFSCSNTPPYPISLFSTRMHKHQNNRHRLANHNPPLAVDDCGDIAIDPAIIKALDMMIKSPAASPTVMPGFMKSPVAHGLEDGQVDENAENALSDRSFISLCLLVTCSKLISISKDQSISDGVVVKAQNLLAIVICNLLKID
ncbi:hypothetical protein E3N88_22859 [Mikania micrantha]|uniref:Uncharacterized protein n=1 Tax=Mikania micrantha TaxID=192012 RepID=A0A5N6NE56_9ASTR|nr:hypothetical protein E3N88_22859 [Mikania micrantha]